jgi:hypothetical protein
VLMIDVLVGLYTNFASRRCVCYVVEEMRAGGKIVQAVTSIRTLFEPSTSHPEQPDAHELAQSLTLLVTFLEYLIPLIVLDCKQCLVHGNAKDQGGSTLVLTVE